MNLINKLLRKNISGAQLAGFVLSNFIGLAIVVAGLQFYLDVRSLWDSEDSFLKKDYLVVNKKVTSANTLGTSDSSFIPEEISDLSKQPWVRSVGCFSSPAYRVSAIMEQGGRAMSTDMFFESIPSEYIDLGDTHWTFSPGDEEVPIIISKDYLALYNFGFASSAGLPQVSEQMMSAIPLTLRLRSDDGTRELVLRGHIAGYSSRLNTILVPKDFLDWSNRELAGISAETPQTAPRRLIIDVSSPGDVAITKYLEDHNMELAGDKSGSQASYLLNIVVGVMLGIGVLITVLSFFILLLSISLLLQKNRDKLHALIMLGVDLGKIGDPYNKLIIGVSLLSWLLAVAAMLIFRGFYIGRLTGIEGAHAASIWASTATGLLLSLISILFNVLSVKKKVRSAFYVS